MPPPPDFDVEGGAAAIPPKEPLAPPKKKVERAAPISQLEEANLEPTGDAGLSHEEAASRLARFGRNELAEHKTSKWLVFLKLLYAPMACAIWAAIAIEAGVGHYVDVGILAFIQFVNAFIGWHETTKSADAVAALKASLKPRATAKRGGAWATLDAGELVPGDLVKIAAGSAVPADCVIRGEEGGEGDGEQGVGVNGDGTNKKKKATVSIDNSAMTGESLPATLSAGGTALMGATCVRGEAEALVTATGRATAFGRTAALLGGDGGSDNITRVLVRVTLVLSLLALALCGVVLAYLLARGREPVREVVSFVVVLLIASIPIAITIVCTTTLAMGARELAAHGAIVARLAAVEELAGLNVLCSDKTGTLTLNKMVIQDKPGASPTFKVVKGGGSSGGVEVEVGDDMPRLLRLAALAAKWREPPADALDTMVLGAADLEALEQYEQVEYEPFDASTKMTRAVVRAPPPPAAAAAGSAAADAEGDDAGMFFGVAKGAAHALAALVPDDDASGSKRAVVAKMDAVIERLAERGTRAMVIARTAPTKDARAVGGASAPWRIEGILSFLDPPRPDSADTLDEAMRMGVDVKMITGDSATIARETARALRLGDSIVAATDVDWPAIDNSGGAVSLPKDLGETVGRVALRADGFAQVFPEHKYTIVEALRQCGLCTGMTGDGVNDAPALKRADVGIAVAGATDAARAAADIVLTEPGLGTVVHALLIARQIFRRINNFVVYRVAATLYLVLFFFISAFALPPSRFSAKSPTRSNAFLLPGDPSSGPWPNFFAIPVLNLMLITLLNDGTFVVIGKDRVSASPRPDKWNLRANFLASSVLAAVPLAASLLALYGALDSHSTSGLFAALRLPPMPYEKIETLMYLLISTCSFLTLFSARERGFFFESRPATILLLASATSLTVTTLLASFWPKGVITGLPMLGLALPDQASDYRLWPVWALLYSVLIFLLQDISKVLAWRLIDRFDVFSYRTSAMVGARAAVRFDDPGARAAREGAGAVEGKLLAFRAARAEDTFRDLTAASAAAAPSSAAAGADGAAAAAAAAPVSSAELERAAAGLSAARARLADALRARRESLSRREEEEEAAAAKAAAASDDKGAPPRGGGDIESGGVIVGGEAGAGDTEAEEERGIEASVLAWEKAAGEAEAVPSLPTLARASLGEARLRVREAGAALGEVISAEEEQQLQQQARLRRARGRGEISVVGGAIGASRNSRQRQRKPVSPPPPHDR